MYEMKREDVLRDFRRFLKVRMGLDEKTVEDHAYMAGKFLDRFEEVIPDKEKARRLKEEMMDQEYSSSHINNTMKAIQYYYQMHDIDFSFKRLKRPKQLPEVLTENEVKRIQYACNTYRDYAIVKTLASSGVRASELCNLDVSDANLDERKLRITQGKGRKDGVSMISETCAEAIREYLRRRDDNKKPLFLSMTGERLTRSGLLQLVKRLGKRANLDRNITVHMFRHYFGTQLISNGADLSIVKELMRHEDVGTTMKYVHLASDTIQEHYDQYSPE